MEKTSVFRIAKCDPLGSSWFSRRFARQRESSDYRLRDENNFGAAKRQAGRNTRNHWLPGEKQLALRSSEGP